MAGDNYTAAFADDLQRQIEDCIAQAEAQQTIPSFLIGVSVGKAHFEGKKFEALLALLAQYKGRINFVFCVGDRLQKYTRAMLSATRSADDCAEDAYQRGSQWLTDHEAQIKAALGKKAVKFIRWPRETTLQGSPSAKLDEIIHLEFSNPGQIIDSLCSVLATKPANLLGKMRKLLVNGKLAEKLGDAQLLLAAQRLLYVHALNEMMTTFLHTKDANILSRNKAGVKAIGSLNPLVNMKRLESDAEYTEQVIGRISENANLTDSDKNAALYVVELLRESADSERHYELSLLTFELDGTSKSIPREKSVITILQLPQYQNGLYCALMGKIPNQAKRLRQTLNATESNELARLSNQLKAVEYTCRYLHWEMVVFTTNPEFIQCYGFVYPGNIGAFEVARLIALPDREKLQFLEVRLRKVEQATEQLSLTAHDIPDSEKIRLQTEEFGQLIGHIATGCFTLGIPTDGAVLFEDLLEYIKTHCIIKNKSPDLEQMRANTPSGIALMQIPGRPGFFLPVPDNATSDEIQQLMDSPPMRRKAKQQSLAAANPPTNMPVPEFRPH